MKVAELIKRLEKLPPDATVLVTSSNFELNGADVPVSGVHYTDEGSKKVRVFRDAFDGETYEKEVWSIINGTEKVVSIS